MKGGGTGVGGKDFRLDTCERMREEERKRQKRHQIETQLWEALGQPVGTIQTLCGPPFIIFPWPLTLGPANVRGRPDHIL